VFVDELLIKNLETNKRNKGGDYLGVMLRWLILVFQISEDMLPQLKHMLHALKLD